MKIILRLLCAGLFGAGIVTTASAANTDGTVTFTYQLVNFSGSYAPNHVDAVYTKVIILVGKEKTLNLCVV